MKVMVEIHDTQVVAVLQDTIRIRLHDFFKQHPTDIVQCVAICAAMNEVIDFFGGCPIDIGDEIAKQGRA